MTLYPPLLIKEKYILPSKKTKSGFYGPSLSPKRQVERLSDSIAQFESDLQQKKSLYLTIPKLLIRNYAMLLN